MRLASVAEPLTSHRGKVPLSGSVSVLQCADPTGMPGINPVSHPHLPRPERGMAR